MWQYLVDESHQAGLAEVLGIDVQRLDPTIRRDEVLDALVAVTEPMIDASVSGAFALVFVNDELLVLTSPQIWTDGAHLHRQGGPAIAWRETRVYAWKGWIMPTHFIRQLAMSPGR